MTIPVMSLGGQGVISVTSNICPKQMVAMTQAAINDDFETASAMQAALQPLIDLMFCEVNPIPVKAALSRIGYDCGDCRLPLCNLSNENAKRIQEFFS